MRSATAPGDGARTPGCSEISFRTLAPYVVIIAMTRGQHAHREPTAREMLRVVLEPVQIVDAPRQRQQLHARESVPASESLYRGVRILPHVADAGPPGRAVREGGEVSRAVTQLENVV